MKQENTMKSPVNLGTILMRVAMVLLALTVISVYLLGGVLARYRGSEDNSDQARVAKFNALTLTVTGNFDDGKAKVYPGAVLQKDAHVDFRGSEAATMVFVEVILTENWHKHGDTYWLGKGTTFSQENCWLSWTVDSFWTYLDEDTVNGQKRYVYYKALAPNETLSADILTNDGEITVSEGIKKTEVPQVANTKITVRAGAIQLGGFATVEEAWESLDR